MTYQYDSLNRLLSASSTQSWSETYGFDGFGNLLSKTGTGGAPTLSQAVSATTNQIVGQNYDSNGNQLSGPLGTVAYDAENRIASMSAGGVQYGYDSRNKRIWKSILAGGNLAQEVYFYGIDGQKIGTYTFTLALYNNVNPEMTDNTGIKLATFFGSKRIGTFDRLGTAKFNANGQPQSFYPYGEDRGTIQPNDSLKFATYTRDTATGLDYADQRYYANNFGRFMSPDPHMAGATPRRPGSWNRYAYTEGDPANRADPSGQRFLSCDTFECVPEHCEPVASSFDVYPDPWGCDTPDPGQSGGGGPVDVGLTDQEERSTIHPGSPIFSSAYRALMRAKNELAIQFLGPQSANCEKDLSAVGVTDAQVWAGALAANIINGMTDFFNTFASDIYGNSPVYSSGAAQFGDINMVQFMTIAAPNAAPVAQIYGSNIYINPSWVNGMSPLDQEAMLLHELLHNITGLADDAIQSALGISTSAASQNIGDKLKKDCLQ